MRVLLLILSLGISTCEIINPPKVEKGILDLSGWDLEKNGSINLNGEWEFYWNQFLFPTYFSKNSSSRKELSLHTKPAIPHLVKIPSSWKGMEINNKKLPGHGFATYRMVLKLGSNENKKLAFRIKDQAHAYNFYLNEELIVKSGTVGDSYENMEPSIYPESFAFTPKEQELELIFHVSNFHHRVGGLRFEIQLGEEKNILSNLEKSYILDAFFFGGFLIISIYHFSIYFFRRKSKSPLFFGFFCLSILMYSIIVGQRFLYNYFPNIWDWETAYKVEFVGIALILMSALSFFNSLYPLEKKNLIIIYKIIFSLPVISCIFILAAKPVVFTEYLIVLELGVILAGILIIVNLVYSIYLNKEGSLVFLIGFLFLFTSAIIDILSIHSIIVLPRLLKFGLASMVLMQSIILAKIFTGDFLKSELLSDSLIKTNRAYSRFIPTEFLNLLNKKSILDIHLGDHTQREMTILFSDIRSFTSLSEKMTPEENFTFLNSYLNRIAPIIQTNHGFIDKYIGDAIMGLFPYSPDDALLASIAMQKEIAEYNVIRKKLGHSQIKVGIGLHTGSLILGTIGHDDRMEGTVISDSVNLASRLEGLTKYYGSNILISENTFQLLEDPTKYNFRLLDNVLVKGKQDSIFVIEILDGFPKELLEKFMETKKDFETGNLLYKQKAFEASIDFFKKVLEINPLDTATEFYLKRAEYYKEHGAPPDWEGGEVFLDK